VRSLSSGVRTKNLQTEKNYLFEIFRYKYANNFPFHQTPTKEISISFIGGASEESLFFKARKKD